MLLSRLRTTETRRPRHLSEFTYRSTAGLGPLSVRTATSPLAAFQNKADFETIRSDTPLGRREGKRFWKF